MSDEREIHQQFSGNATGNVIQAGSIGYIVNNPPMLKETLAEEIPPSVDHYINYDEQLGAITRAARPETDEDGPFVVEIAGEPGSGKSEVAYQWAKRYRADFPGGRFYATLGQGVDPYSVLARWLRYFGYAYEQLPPTLSGISSHWRSVTARRRVLILLDGAGSEDIEHLLPGAGHSTVLVIPAPRAELEQFRARHGAELIRLTPLKADQALALLTHRLDKGREGQGRVEREREAAIRLITICGHSAGALNVAAGMLLADEDGLIEELLERLERKGVTTHLRLTAIFDAAYDLLEAEVQQIYRALGSHPAPRLAITRQAVAAALSLDPGDVGDALDVLRQASLVGRAGRGTYQLSTLIADHAARRAGEELPVIRDAFIAYYRDHGLRCAETLKPGRGVVEGIRPLADHDQAQAWLVDNEVAIFAAAEAAAKSGDHRSAVLLCVVAWPIYQRGQNSARMAELFQLGVAAASALAERDVADQRLLSIMLTQLGFAYRQQRNWDLTVRTFERAATIGSPESRQSAGEGTGLALRDQGKIVEARAVLAENLRQAKAIADAYEGTDENHLKGLRRRVFMARFHLGTVLDPAEAVVELPVVREAFLAEPENLVKISLWLGRKLNEQHDRLAALPVLELAAELARKDNLRRELGLIHLELAEADQAGADEHLRTALRVLEFLHEPEADLVRARMAGLELAEQS